MLLLQRQRKAVDNAAQDLEQLCQWGGGEEQGGGGGEATGGATRPHTRPARAAGAPTFRRLTCDAIVVLCLENKPEKHKVDGFADEGAVHHELAVHAVQDGLQVVAFPRVLCGAGWGNIGGGEGGGGE